MALRNAPSHVAKCTLASCQGLVSYPFFGLTVGVSEARFVQKFRRPHGVNLHVGCIVACGCLTEQAARGETSSGYRAPAESTPMPSHRKHLLLSGRFNSEEKLEYMRRVKELLEAKQVPVFMVRTQGAGDRYGPQTDMGLYEAKALLAFCTSDYGAKTGAEYETYIELQYARQKKLIIIPVQLCSTFPPQPSDKEGRAQNDVALWNDVIRIEDIGMQEPERVAEEVAKAWTTWIARPDMVPLSR